MQNTNKDIVKEEKKVKKVLLDTNILLSNPEVLDEEGNEKYVICLTTLREIDKLKRKPELNYAARNAIKAIKRNIKQITIDTNEKLDTNSLTNDEKIVIAAKNNGYAFRTEDIGAAVIAELEGVEVDEDKTEEEIYDVNYKGYKEKNITDDAVWNLLYHSDKIDSDLVTSFTKKLSINQYIILFNKGNKEEYVIMYKNFQGDGCVVPLKKYKKLIKSVDIEVEPLDAYQWIAVDCVLNPNPITIIEGVLGTGKTLLAIIGALMQTKTNDSLFKRYSKIKVTKPPIPIDKRYQMGYLPGDLENKMAPWLLSFKSNLEFLYETNQENIESKKSDEIFSKYFFPVSLEHIQGASIHNSIVIIDEYQLLDVAMLKQLLSRIATGSKIILVGDTEGQTYNINRGNEGFKVLKKHMKNQKLLNFVKLENIYRSDLAKFVESIFRN